MEAGGVGDSQGKLNGLLGTMDDLGGSVVVNGELLRFKVYWEEHVSKLIRE